VYTRELLLSLRRRWYLLLVAVLLTAGACLGVSHVVAPTYEAKASLVLIPPRDTQFPDTNRYLMLNSLGQATGVVIRALNGDTTHQAVVDGTLDGDFGVTPDYTTNAPILVITATSAESKVAQEVLQRVEAQVPQILSRLQSSVDIANGAQITTVPVTTATQPTKVVKKQLRAVAASGLALAAILTLLIGAIDGYLVRRASGAAEEDDDETASVNDPDPLRRPQRRAADLKAIDINLARSGEADENPGTWPSRHASSRGAGTRSS